LNFIFAFLHGLDPKATFVLGSQMTNYTDKAAIYFLKTDRGWFS